MARRVLRRLLELEIWLVIPNRCDRPSSDIPEIEVVPLLVGGSWRYRWWRRERRRYSVIYPPLIPRTSQKASPAR